MQFYINEKTQEIKIISFTEKEGKFDIYNINLTSQEKNLESIFTFKFQNNESKPKIINLTQDKFLIFFDDNNFIYIINTNKTFDLFKGNLENFKSSENSLISLTNISSENYFIIIKDKKVTFKAINLNPKINKSSEVKFENESFILNFLHIITNTSNY